MQHPEAAAAPSLRLSDFNKSEARTRLLDAMEAQDHFVDDQRGKYENTKKLSTELSKVTKQYGDALERLEPNQVLIATTTAGLFGRSVRFRLKIHKISQKEYWAIGASITSGRNGSIHHARRITLGEDGRSDPVHYILKVGTKSEQAGVEALQESGLDADDKHHTCETPQQEAPDRAQHYTLMPHAGLNLETVLDQYADAFPLKAKVQIIIQMYEIIQTLHSRGYALRDIKPSNFCLRKNNDNTFTVSLIDLEGVAKEMAADEGNQRDIATPCYCGVGYEDQNPFQKDWTAFAFSVLAPERREGFIPALLKHTDRLETDPSDDARASTSKAKQAEAIKTQIELLRRYSPIIDSEDAGEARNPEHASVMADNMVQALAKAAGLSYPGWNAKFSGQNLSGKDLSSAQLHQQNLTGADLSGADLSGADLSGADLTGVNLTGADLTGADLTGANLTEANLEGARYELSQLDATQIKQVKLNPNFIKKVHQRQLGEDSTEATLEGETLEDVLSALLAVSPVVSRGCGCCGFFSRQAQPPQGSLAQAKTIAALGDQAKLEGALQTAQEATAEATPLPY